VYAEFILAGSPMKTALRIVALALTTVIGLWAVGHGIILAVAIQALAREHADIGRELIEVGVSIAGGICVLSVAVEQLYCWRTHHKEDSLL
jgi:hypothetical protein